MTETELATILAYILDQQTSRLPAVKALARHHVPMSTGMALMAFGYRAGWQDCENRDQEA